MNVREDFVFWRLAYFFISDHGYRIIQLFDNQKELWLEKIENKRVPIIRLLRQDLDWSSHMQRDIEFSAVNGERVRRQLGRSELKMMNIYVSQFPPVDEYEFRLAKPFIFPEGNKTIVNTLLLTSDNYEAGFKRISEQFESEVVFPIEADYTEQDVESEKKAAIGFAIDKAKNERAIFTYGKPFFSIVFIAIQVAIFFWLELHGGSTNTSTLIKYGAKYNPSIYAGEWWRFITPVFLHIGFVHLMMNSLALYFLGSSVEKIFGSARFLLIYLFAGATGVIASFIFSPVVSAGASGAIFGCFGALLYFGLINPKLFLRTMGVNLFVILAINLVFGFSVSGIDNAGHLGGLAGGFLAAGVLHFPKKKKPLLQLVFLIFSFAIVYSSLLFGFSNQAKASNESSYLILPLEYIKQEQYEDAYKILKDYEKETDNPSAKILFLLSETERIMGMSSDAKNHLQMALQLEPDFSEAYYMLALLYYEENDFVQAKEYAEKAAKLKPDLKEYSELVQLLSQY